MSSLKRITFLGFIIWFMAYTNVVWAKADLTKVRIGQSADKTRVVFEIKKNHRFEVSKLQNPARIVVDFYKAKNHLKFAKKNFLDKRLKRMRVKNQSNRTRVVLDLRQDYQYRYFTLAKNKSGAERVVIDLTKPKKLSTQKRTNSVVKKATVKPSASKPKVVAKKTKVQPKTKSTKQTIKPKKTMMAKKALPNQKLKTTKVKSKPQLTDGKLASQTKDLKLDKPSRVLTEKKQLIVAIDPGHGGKDPGAIGKYGTKEKDVALAISKKLQRYINQTPGMKAIMTRESDVFVPLRKRVQIAHRKNADIFLSIHADAFPQARVEGGSVYVLSTRGASSLMARLLSKKENSKLKTVDLDGREKDVAFVLSDMTREANIRASRKLGNVMIHEMSRSVKMHKRRVQSANFAVLKSIDMPSLLIETAFLSTPKEEKKLKNPEFQKRMAKSIVKGLNKFVTKTPNRPLWGETLYVHYKVQRGDTLSEIATHYRVSVGKLKTVNKIKNSNHLFVGRKLKIPLSDKLLATL